MPPVLFVFQPLCLGAYGILLRRWHAQSTLYVEIIVSAGHFLLAIWRTTLTFPDSFIRLNTHSCMLLETVVSETTLYVLYLKDKEKSAYWSRLENAEYY